MRSHQFSSCCMVPLRSGNICSACNRQAEIVTEQDPHDAPVLPEYFFPLNTPPFISIISLETLDDHFKVTYNDESGLQIDHCSLDHVLEWGRHTWLWSPVFVQHHFDEVNEEDYTSLWSWRPYQQVEIPADYQHLEISQACQQMNATRKKEFIQSVNIKIIGDYLCQLQRQQVEQ